VPKKLLRKRSAGHAKAHSAVGWAYILTNRVALGIAESERAIALDRNHAPTHAHIGFAEVLVGHAEETEGHIIQALRLSPRDTSAYFFCGVAGTAKLFLGQDDEALVWLHRSIECNRTISLLHFFVAAALAQQGKAAESQAAAKAGLVLHPTFTIRRFYGGALSSNATYLTQRERVSKGMRMAGVPEE
jgi:tetratricopeptide (TPR) repeat protein